MPPAALISAAGKIQPKLGLVAEELETTRKGLHHADLDRAGAQHGRHWQGGGKRCRSCTLQEPATRQVFHGFPPFSCNYGAEG